LKAATRILECKILRITIRFKHELRHADVSKFQLSKTGSITRNLKFPDRSLLKTVVLDRFELQLIELDSNSG
jgi:hypothetical protein